MLCAYITASNVHDEHNVLKAKPLLFWVKDYRRDYLKHDVTAGVTVAVLLIPQAMAYALLADLPPITGLYAALAGLVIYALLGSSRHLSVGPVALDSLLVASGLGLLIANATSGEYLGYAITLAVMVGSIQIMMGLLRMGYLVNFLANPVINGFTSAAAIIIALSQLKHMLGVEVAASQHAPVLVLHLIKQIANMHAITLATGCICLAMLLILRRGFPQLPAALVTVVLSTLAVWLGDLEAMGLSVIGTIPRGLPALTLPNMEIERIVLLLSLAATIALVGFMESIAVAKRFAAQNRYEVNANRELVSLGAGNIGAGLVGGYPVAGSFSRTAINADIGAKTPLASLVTATLIALTLIALTPLFYYTPIACLAAVILVAIKGLIDLQEPRRLYKINKKDFSLLLFAFFATLLLGIQYGVLLSVLVSIMLIFSRITRPPVVHFGRLPDTNIFRNLSRDPNAKIIPGVIIFRIDSSLYFANVTYLKDKIYEAIAQREDKIHAFLIDASTTNEVDTSAITCLQEIAYEFKQTGIELYFTNVRGRIRDTMRRSGFADQLGDKHFFFSKTAAIKHIETLSRADTPQR